MHALFVLHLRYKLIRNIFKIMLLFSKKKVPKNLMTQLKYSKGLNITQLAFGSRKKAETFFFLSSIEMHDSNLSLLTN